MPLEINYQMVVRAHGRQEDYGSFHITSAVGRALTDISLTPRTGCQTFAREKAKTACGRMAMAKGMANNSNGTQPYCNSSYIT